MKIFQIWFSLLGDKACYKAYVSDMGLIWPVYPARKFLILCYFIFIVKCQSSKNQLTEYHQNSIFRRGRVDSMYSSTLNV